MLKLKKDKKGLYYFRQRFGKDTEGNPIQIYRGGFKTQKEATACYNQILQEVTERKSQSKYKTSDEPLNVYFEKWFHKKYKRNVAETTAQNRWYAIKKHIIPYFNDVPLSKVTTLMLEEFYADKLDEGLAPKTVREFHNLLNKALAQAVTWEKIKTNPARKAEPPIVTLKEVDPWTVEQTKQFFKVVEEAGEDDFYVVAVFTGMRRGEILGLKWEDIDFERGKISIQRSLARVKGKGLILKDVKTKKSRRQISISPYVVNKLKQRREKQEKWIKESRGAIQNLGMVFVSETGYYKDPDNLLREFYRWIKKADVPKGTIHDLRHFHATQLMKNGVNPKVVSERLGHNGIEITMDLYSHVTDDLQEEAALVMEKSFMKLDERV